MRYASAKIGAKLVQYKSRALELLLREVCVDWKTSLTLMRFAVRVGVRPFPKTPYDSGINLASSSMAMPLAELLLR
jgi:hypothetical protein